MRFASLLPRKGAVYGGAAVLLGLMPPEFVLTVRGAEPPPRLAAISVAPREDARDWVLANQARRALLKDEQIASFNVGVSVKDKVATIWGTLPSAEVGKRIEEMLKKINGIASVVNECKIVPPASPVPQQVADAVKRLQDGEEVASRPVAPPAATTGRQVVAKPAPEMLAPRPVNDPHEARLTPLQPPPAAVLLPPVLSSDAPTMGNDSVETVRNSEPRFKEVALDVKGGVVKINGRVGKMKDAWDLAEKLNNVNGIRQVILGNVQEK
jgi:BON domain